MADKRPTPAQLKALKSARDHGSPTHHIVGRSEWAGWGGTREAMIRRAWINISCQITERGRRVLEEEEARA